MQRVDFLHASFHLSLMEGQYILLKHCSISRFIKNVFISNVHCCLVKCCSTKMAFEWTQWMNFEHSCLRCKYSFLWQLIHLLLSLSQHYYPHSNIPYHKLSTHYNLLNIGISLCSLNTVYRKPMKEVGRRLHSVLYLTEWFSLQQFSGAHSFYHVFNLCQQIVRNHTVPKGNLCWSLLPWQCSDIRSILKGITGVQIHFERAYSNDQTSETFDIQLCA